MVAREDSTIDPLRGLVENAAHLDSICDRDPNMEPFYDLMSGALVWPDETRPDTPTKVVWALRMLWAYWTSLMLNAPRDEFARYWELGLAEFPRWVGFRAERRTASPDLLQIHHRGSIALRKCLRDSNHDGANI
jgi:hypothetical protein